MKRILYMLTLMAFTGVMVQAQKNLNIGAGYFGHTLTHPGLVLEAEIEHMYSERTSLPIFVNMGGYLHPRNHLGAFLEVGTGFRQYFTSGLFLEERVAAGVLQTFLHSDAVYRVDDSGQVSEGSRVNQVDFMPSVSLGLGYRLGGHPGGKNMIWLRPKLFFQLPYKTMANYHVAVQVGFTHTFGNK